MAADDEFGLAQRAADDRKNPSHWFQGRTYTFGELEKLRQAEDFASQIRIEVRREREQHGALPERIFDGDDALARDDESRCRGAEEAAHAPLAGRKNYITPSGLQRLRDELRWLPKPVTFKMPVYGSNPDKTVTLPRAWWVPATLPHVIDLLKLHGIAIGQRTGPERVVEIPEDELDRGGPHAPIIE